MRIEHTAHQELLEKYEKLLALAKTLVKTRYDLWFHVDLDDGKVQLLNIHDECKKVLKSIDEE